MLSGSVAMSIYVTPCMTRDFHFIIHLEQNGIENFSKQFKEGFYFGESAIKDAIRFQSMFNILGFKSGCKADFVILKKER